MSRALETLDGVEVLQVSYPEKMAVVRINDPQVTVDQMSKVLFKAGFVAAPK